MRCEFGPPLNFQPRAALKSVAEVLKKAVPAGKDGSLAGLDCKQHLLWRSYVDDEGPLTVQKSLFGIRYFRVNIPYDYPPIMCFFLSLDPGSPAIAR